MRKKEKGEMGATMKGRMTPMKESRTDMGVNYLETKMNGFMVIVGDYVYYNFINNVVRWGKIEQNLTFIPFFNKQINI